MKIICRPITDSRNPVVDFGDSWGRIDENSEPLFAISKKDQPNWLAAFVSKWMQEGENLTEFGKHYCNLLFIKDKDLKKSFKVEGGRTKSGAELIDEAIAYINGLT